MPVRKVPAELLRFGVFEVDRRAGEIRKHGVRIKLQDQPFQLLQLLMERRGEVVTREELRQRIWPSDTFVDFEHGLYSAMARLRLALGDSSSQPLYIETLSRRGYRLIADVTEDPPLAMAVAVPEASEPPIETAPAAQAARRKRMPSAAAAALLFLAGLASMPVFFAPQPKAHTLAVLPFSADSKLTQVVADSMTAGIIDSLSNLGDPLLKLKAQGTVMRYKDASQDPVEAGHELGADSVLLGRTFESGGKLGFEASLVRVVDGVQVWSKTGSGYELFQADSLREEIVREVAGKVPVRLSAAELAKITRPHHQPEPHAAALERKAVHAFWTGTPASMRAAIEYSEQAIKLDPYYAMAYGEIASAYSAMGELGFISADEADAKSVEWALRALQIDPNDFGARLVLPPGKNFASAWSGIDKLTPLHPFYDKHAAAEGNLEETERRNEAYLAENPDSPGAHDVLAGTLILERRYQAAAEQAKIALQLDPSRAWSHFILGRAYLQMRRFAEARQEFEESRPGLEVFSLAALGRADALSGHREDALARLSDLVSRSEREYVSPVIFARIHAALGDRQQAFDWLKKGCDQRSSDIRYIKVDPDWDGLRSGRQYADLMHCVDSTS